MVVLIYSLVAFIQGLDSGFIPFFRNWPALVPRGAGGRAEWF